MKIVKQGKSHSSPHKIKHNTLKKSNKEWKKYKDYSFIKEGYDSLRFHMDNVFIYMEQDSPDFKDIKFLEKIFNEFELKSDKDMVKLYVNIFYCNSLFSSINRQFLLTFSFLSDADISRMKKILDDKVYKEEKYKQMIKSLKA